MEWFRELIHNPLFIIMAICVGVPVIGGITADIVKQIIRHRERMAMIDQGINPDAQRPKDKP